MCRLFKSRHYHQSTRLNTSHHDWPGRAGPGRARPGEVGPGPNQLGLRLGLFPHISLIIGLPAPPSRLARLGGAAELFMQACPSQSGHVTGRVARPRKGRRASASAPLLQLQAAHTPAVADE